MTAYTLPGVQTIEIGVTTDSGTSYKATRMAVTRDGHGRIVFNDGVKDIVSHSSDEGIAKLFKELAAIAAS